MVSKSATTAATVDLAALRAFAQAARRRGITAAAEALGLPKSSVSKSIAALERRLSVKLLERNSRRVAPTREGEALLAQAESILAEVDRLVAHAQEEFVQPAGAVHVAATPEFGALLAERFVPTLLARYPRLRVALRLEYRHDDLLDPALDLAFRIGSVQAERLVARELGSFRRVLVASREYLRAHPIAKPEDLARVECLLFSDRELAAQWTLQSSRASKARECEVPVKGRLAVRGFTALLHAAQAGLGIARVPDFVAVPALAGGAVVRVLPQWAAPPSTVYLVHRFGAERVGRVRAAIETARELVPALLGRP
jgi:DNA-binding transcriptional LysR family regulator